MFKKFPPSFFSDHNDGKKEDRLSQSVTPWRLTVSPVPSFLLRPQSKIEKGKKETVLKKEEKDSLKKQDSKKDTLRVNSELPRIYLTDQEKKIFGKKSPYDIQNTNERYVFTMTKFSFWTVLGSLLILGILFFFCGFGLALYLMTSSPSFLAKIEHKISWKGKNLEEVLEKKMDSHEQHTTKNPEKTTTPAAAQEPLIMARVASMQNTSSPSHAPLPISEPAPEGMPSSEKVSHKEPTPATSSSSSLSSSPLKKSPLLSSALKNAPQELSSYSLEYGAFVTRADALKRVDELTQKGYHPIVVRIKGALHTVSFSVRCGEYSTRESAVKDLQHADKEFGPRVVRNSSEATVVYP
ncbi:MAG: SPOR domain-containing protein [Proteobacteria bacterium]|nr:SPOR domain-containing protein [Pseudomonadota bacterium]